MTKARNVEFFITRFIQAFHKCKNVNALILIKADIIDNHHHHHVPSCTFKHIGYYLGGTTFSVKCG